LTTNPRNLYQLACAGFKVHTLPDEEVKYTTPKMNSLTATYLLV
jgi:hypothetical protein